MPDKRNVSVAIIGAGAAGILSAIKLRQAGISRISVFEKESDLGGTWRDNTYPGLICDIPSHLYRFSFAPNPDWSRTFSPGAEIYAYVRKVAEDNNVEDLIAYRNEVTKLEYDGSTWRLESIAHRRRHRGGVQSGARGSRGLRCASRDDQGPAQSRTLAVSLGRALRDRGDHRSERYPTYLVPLGEACAQCSTPGTGNVYVPAVVALHLDCRHQRRLSFAPSSMGSEPTREMALRWASCLNWGWSCPGTPNGRLHYLLR